MRLVDLRRTLKKLDAAAAKAADRLALFDDAVGTAPLTPEQQQLRSALEAEAKKRASVAQQAHEMGELEQAKQRRRPPSEWRPRT